MKLLQLLRFWNPEDSWQAKKSNSKVYPKPKYATMTTTTKSGNTAHGKVNMAYRWYRFKKFTPYNLHFTVWIERKDVKPDDAEVIQAYFEKHLRAGCTAHCVGNLVTDYGLNLDFYVDDLDYTKEILGVLSKQEKDRVDFGVGFNRDPTWEAYKRLIGLTYSSN